jgi:hypothetical protein
MTYMHLGYKCNTLKAIKGSYFEFKNQSKQLFCSDCFLKLKNIKKEWIVMNS